MCDKLKAETLLVMNPIRVQSETTKQYFSISVYAVCINPTFNIDYSTLTFHNLLLRDLSNSFNDVHFFAKGKVFKKLVLFNDF